LNCANRERKLNEWVELIKKILSMWEKKSHENLINALLEDEEH